MRAGEVIGGRFVVEREVASGGMGTVHRALDRDRSVVVALKVMIGHDAAAAARFVREAEALADVDHPAIVAYVAHGLSASGPWLAMEWLAGEDLSSRLSRGALSIDAAVACARRVAQALAALHRRGLVHRDVKPSNVFLVDGDPSRAKLLDLGVARRIREANALTGTGVAIGTPYYMAPEQARAARDLDARVDVFALGAVLYEAVAGQPPFRGENLVEVLAKIVLEPSPSLGARAPRSLDAIVSRCLAKSREERFADGAALADALATIDDETRPLTVAQSTPRTLGASERRVVTVLLVGRADPLAATMAAIDAGDAYARVHQAIASQGATGERLLDGSVIVALSEPAVPIDQATAAARIARAVRAAVAELPLAIATGRAELTGNAPIGEAVSRAAKALSSAQAGAIRLDDDAASLLAARYVIDRDDQGAILSAERSGEAARLLLGRATPFVGRDREVSVLEGLFHECVEEPIARAALVTAAAGSGKSRLRDEMLARLERSEARPEIFIGVADVLRAGAPFAVLSSALRRSSGVFDGEPIEVQRDKLRARVARSVKPEVARHALPFLGEICGIGFDDEGDQTLRAARRDPLMMADHVRVAFEELLSAECARQPVLLVLDDLHWGDLPSVRVIDAALRALHDRPLFVLALARPEVHDLFPRLLHERQLQEVRLGALSRRACERLIRDALDARATEEIVSWIAERAQGNPFFVEELIRAIASRGTRDVPDTVLGVVQARLDALGADAKRALRAASVFGETFWRGGVRALIGDDPALEGALRDLVEREVVTESPGARFPGEQALVFRHALIRDAAYAMLTDHDRALAHLRARDWLEAHGDLDAVELAQHAERGGDRTAAATWWARAAEDALEVNDLAAAIERAERGALCGASGELLARLRLGQTIASMWQGDHAAALARAEQALAEARPSSRDWFRAAAEGIAAVGRLGDRDDMPRRLERLLEAPAEESAVDEQVIALCRAFVPASNAGLSIAGDMLEKATSVAAGRSLGAIARAQLREAQGLDLAMRAAPQEGEACLLEAIAAYAEGGAARDRCLTMTSLAWVYLSAGNVVRAERTIDEALQMAAAMRIQQGLAWATQMRGMILGLRGRDREAVPMLVQAAETFRAQRNARQEGWTLSALARARLELGDADLAYEDATRAIELLSTNPVLVHWALSARARAALARGALDDALADATRGVEHLRGQPWKLDRGVTYRALAEVHLARGEAEAAAEAVRTAAGELRAIADSLRDEEWRSQFLAMPDHAWLLSRA